MGTRLKMKLKSLIKYIVTQTMCNKNNKDLNFAKNVLYKQSTKKIKRSFWYFVAI